MSLLPQGTMSLFPRWSRLRKHREHEAELEEQVTALQAALSQCRNAAGYWARLRAPLKAAIILLLLALGFVLGMLSDTLWQSVADRGGSASSAVPNGGAAFAAYQERDFAKALSLSRPLAEQGHARARTVLGLILLNGHGMPKDEKQAAHWFRLAAEDGDAQAQFHLGNMYSQGLGVPQDYVEAVKWYQRAADQGNPQAQYNLGLWYATGEGGALDIVSAYMWFNLAAARFPASDTRNRDLAIKNRDIVAKQMSREEIAKAQELAREWRPK
jgi:TPR repeat protein